VLQDDYRTITNGFLAFPVDLPGTDLNKAVKARASIIHHLTGIAARAKERMGKGEDPACLIDFWMEGTVKAIEEAKAKGGPMPLHSTDHEVACIVLDFLFASQDASTSSLTFTLHLLLEHPTVLQQVRDEQAAVRRDPAAPIDLDTLARFTYTSQVMKEVLRCRPPAPIVPHLTKVDYELTESYKAPAGSLVIPSIWACNRVGYANPEAFEPDRFDAKRAEDKKFPMNFLTFGAGPHYCLGQRYAMNHIMLFMSLMVSEADFTRKQTPNMDEIMYAPTIYPADGCVLLTLTPRR